MEDYPRIRQVRSSGELVRARFADGVNALCWQRHLAGDFAELAALSAPSEGVAVLEPSDLASLPLSAAGRVALEALLGDQALLSELGVDPVLNCIRGYPRDLRAGPVATDVYSFHVDSAPVNTDTWLCTYHGAATQALRNEDAVRRVDVPMTRAQLLAEFGGEEGPSFDDFLQERCYDVQFTPRAGAEPWSLGTFNLWRVAVQHPGSPVPAFIHRAPPDVPGAAPRLLLIA